MHIAGGGGALAAARDCARGRHGRAAGANTRLVLETLGVLNNYYLNNFDCEDFFCYPAGTMQFFEIKTTILSYTYASPFFL